MCANVSIEMLRRLIMFSLFVLCNSQRTIVVGLRETVWRYIIPWRPLHYLPIDTSAMFDEEAYILLEYMTMTSVYYSIMYSSSDIHSDSFLCRHAVRLPIEYVQVPGTNDCQLPVLYLSMERLTSAS